MIPADGAPARPSLRVLIVDDEPSVRTLITRILDAAGYQVLTASDGAAALALAEAGARFDLLVTDIRMPGLSGEQLVQSLRQRQPRLPVVYLAGCIDDLAHHATLGGNDLVLQKPVARKDLLAAIACRATMQMMVP